MGLNGTQVTKQWGLMGYHWGFKSLGFQPTNTRNLTNYKRNTTHITIFNRYTVYVRKYGMGPQFAAFWCVDFWYVPAIRLRGSLFSDPTISEETNIGGKKHMGQQAFPHHWENIKQSGLPLGYLTVRHGIDGPNRNRWFTWVYLGLPIENGGSFHGYVTMANC